MRLSVVIPVYNHLDKVLRCVGLLMTSAAISHQYIIQDDCSPAFDFNLINNLRVDGLTVNRNEYNLGFNGNSARGASYATGDLVAIVNQDIYPMIVHHPSLDAFENVSVGWDTHIIAAFDDPQVGIVGPRLLFPDGRIQSAGGEFDGKSQPTHRYLGYSDITYLPVNTPECVEWITGAFFVVRRSLWDALGGFDPLFAPAYWEDVDFCLRARDIGFKTWYEPRATFVHEVGSSGSSGLVSGAQKFYERWVASGKVKPSTPAVKERFW